MTITEAFLQWAVDHEHTFRTLAAMATIIFGALSCTLGVVGARIYELYRRRQQVKEYRRMENPGVAVVEAHALTKGDDGAIQLNVISWGGKHGFTDLFHDPVLESKLEKIARRREGFLHLEHPGQLMVMDALQETITGNDASANLDSLKGRPTHVDEVVMCPITWPGLREAHLIRVIIIDKSWMNALCDESVIEEILATRSRYQHRTKWLHQIALQWQEEQAKSEEEACMRLVKIESQRFK
jgi:hypothetical protein